MIGPAELKMGLIQLAPQTNGAVLGRNATSPQPSTITRAPHFQCRAAFLLAGCVHSIISSTCKFGTLYRACGRSLCEFRTATEYFLLLYTTLCSAFKMSEMNSGGRLSVSTSSPTSTLNSHQTTTHHLSCLQAPQAPIYFSRKLISVWSKMLQSHLLFVIYHAFC